jgi:hypothetical protein
MWPIACGAGGSGLLPAAGLFGQNRKRGVQAAFGQAIHRYSGGMPSSRAMSRIARAISMNSSSLSRAARSAEGREIVMHVHAVAPAVVAGQRLTVAGRWAV